MNTLTATLSPAASDAHARPTAPQYPHTNSADPAEMSPRTQASAARRDHSDPGASRLAQHPRDDGAGLHRADRDLVGVAPRDRCAHRHGAGDSRLHDDDDAGRRRDRRRHLLGRGTRARRRPPRRCRRARPARDPDQSRLRHRDVGDLPHLRAADLHGDGRPRRIARCSAQVLQRRLRGQCPDLADERPCQRDPRHRQHAGAVDGDLPRGRPPRAAVARADLRPRADPGPRHRRRRPGRAADDDADDGRAGLVHPVGTKPGAAEAGPPQLADVRRHPARRRRRCHQHAADGR